MVDEAEPTRRKHPLTDLIAVAVESGVVTARGLTLVNIRTNSREGDCLLIEWESEATDRKWIQLHSVNDLARVSGARFMFFECDEDADAFCALV